MFTITSGQSLSAPQTLNGNTIIGIQFTSSAWTSATIAFQGSVDGVIYGPIYNTSGSEVTITVPAFVAGLMIVFTPDLIVSLGKIRFIKLVSGTTAAPVTQGGTRTIIPVCGAL